MKSIPNNALKRALGWWRALKGAPQPAPEPIPLETPTDAIYMTGSVIFRVPLTCCVYPHGMSFGPDGWHPFVETLKAYRNDRDLLYEGSPLETFYATFQPGSMLELLYPRDVVRVHADAPLADYGTGTFQPFLPWDGAIVSATGEKHLDAAHGHQGFGPVSEKKGRFEFERLRTTFESIEAHGYRPRPGRSGEIRGYFLTDGDRWRFVVRAGHHRTASLAALGHESIRVGFFHGFTRSVDAATMERWPLVRNGPYDRTLARILVDLILSTAGLGVADEAGSESTART